MQDESQRQANAMRRFREQIMNCDEPVPELERIKLREMDCCFQTQFKDDVLDKVSDINATDDR